MKYAATTQVPVSQTRSEIEKLLECYKAEGFAFAQTSERAAIQFQMRDRRIKFLLPLPTLKEVARDGRGNLRTERAASTALAQAQRQRWRALLLTIKAKLESVESKIETFEEAFLAHVVMEDGRTLGEVVGAHTGELAVAKLPPLLEHRP